MKRLGLLLLLGGCYSGGTEYYERDLPPVDLAYAPNWDDVRDVIWLEWGRSSWADVAEGYRRRDVDKLDEGEMLVLLFMARKLGQPLTSLMDLYLKKEKNLHEVVLATEFSGREFFVTIRETQPAPGVYTRPYWQYRHNDPIVLGNEEYVALVFMRIGMEYYAFSADKYFYHYFRVHGFQPFFTLNFKRAGAGGRDAVGETAVIRERPWSRQTSAAFIQNREDHVPKPEKK